LYVIAHNVPELDLLTGDCYSNRQRVMKLLSKVVWSEGMYLGPHHFQVQSRYFEDSIQFATSSLWFAAYGLAGVELDADALHNGTVSLLHARGIFPDGLPFNMPESEALPPARAVADLFPPTRDGVTVLLAIPPRKPDGLNCRLDEGDPSSARYSAESRVLHDENTGADERPVRLGRKNVRLLLDTEPHSDLIALPVARVVRDGSGHFTADSNFVPPVLQIGASARLMLLVQRLIEILDDKSASISRSPGRGGPSGPAEFSTREIANFWLLHSVNSALAPLRHLLVTKRGHPEELFLELSRLAGALCTFALESHPRNLPLYDHDNLSESFDKLDRHIRAHLETIVPTNCISIPLTASENYFYEGEVTDQRCLNRSRWVLAVRANVGEAELMANAPRLVKVCTPPFVRELVKRALPGMALTHLAVPPAAISARVETQYFGIARTGPCWDHLVQTRRVGVYVPGEFPNPEVEILVVLET
jgi:type VI secretion system protein ImpJ